MSKCCHCKKETFDVKYQDYSFKHKGLTFYTYKNSLSCEDCIKKQLIDVFEAYPDFIEVGKDGSLTVNWAFYKTIRQSWRSDDKMYDLHRILYAVGVFTANSKGSYLVLVDQVQGNPAMSTVFSFFTRETNAKDFASTMFENATVWKSCE